MLFPEIGETAADRPPLSPQAQKARTAPLDDPWSFELAAERHFIVFQKRGAFSMRAGDREDG
jgi:hypothetical protein